jgi:hypothetical protein
MKTYHAWRKQEGSVFVSLGTYSREDLAGPGESIEFLFDIEAATGEEAAAICNLRMGFGPYEPIGEPKRCPTCVYWYYPDGSGECWLCGKIG